MSFAFGIFTSDPNLLRCELLRLRPEVGLGRGDEPVGAAWYADGKVLVQRTSAHARPEGLDQLGGVLESEALLVHGGALPLGLSVEENAQPFRSGEWIFLSQGTNGSEARLRARALEGLPDHLQRMVRGSTSAEVAFALFLNALREAGRAGDPLLDPKSVASALGAAARRLESLTREFGGRALDAAMIATNGQSLAAARLGEGPLQYRLLEGSADCERCGIDHASAGEKESLRRAHLRQRSVAVATDVRAASGWIPLESGSSIAVGTSLHPERVSF